MVINEPFWIVFHWYMSVCVTRVYWCSGPWGGEGVSLLLRHRVWPPTSGGISSETFLPGERSCFIWDRWDLMKTTLMKRIFKSAVMWQLATCSCDPLYTSQNANKWNWWWDSFSLNQFKEILDIITSIKIYYDLLLSCISISLVYLINWTLTVYPNSLWMHEHTVCSMCRRFLPWRSASGWLVRSGQNTSRLVRGEVPDAAEEDLRLLQTRWQTKLAPHRLICWYHSQATASHWSFSCTRGLRLYSQPLSLCLWSSSPGEMGRCMSPHMREQQPYVGNSFWLQWSVWCCAAPCRLGV